MRRRRAPPARSRSTNPARFHDIVRHSPAQGRRSPPCGNVAVRGHSIHTHPPLGTIQMAVGIAGSHKWSAEQSAELYSLPGWGSPYFSIGEDGAVRVHPHSPEGPSASLVDIIDRAKRQGMSLPLLLRFDGILRHRLKVLSNAFRQAADEYGFPGRHRPVYPIKVNQQRQLVEVLLEAGRE